MPSPDPRSRSRVQQVVASAAAVLLPVVAAVWALRPVTLPALPQPVEVGATAAVAEARDGTDAAAWQVELWQALRDPPPAQPVVAPPPPLTAQLLAIALRDGQRVAVLELEAGGALHYVPAGGRAGRYSVLRIEDRAVVLGDAGREARLELPR